MKIVKKMDGAEEPYIKEKIIVSCVKCGASIEIAREIADNIENNLIFPTTTLDIRKMVLKELEKYNINWAICWINYDKEIKKRDLPYR